MQTSSSHSSSLAVANGRADEVDGADRVKSVVVVDVDEEREGIAAVGCSSAKLRHDGNSNGSSAGSPLTPSTVESGPEDPTPQQPQSGRQQVQRSRNAADAQPSSSAPPSQQGVLTTSSMVSPSSASSPVDTRSHVLRVDLSAAGGGALAPRRLARTLHLQPASAQGPFTASFSSPSMPPHAQGEQNPTQPAEDAPPAKRLRLSLTTAAAAAAATTTTTAPPSTAFVDPHEAPTAVNSTGRRRVLRLTPAVTASASMADVRRHAPLGASPPVEAKANDEQSRQNEKDTQALSCSSTAVTVAANPTNTDGIVAASVDVPPATVADVTVAATASAPAPSPHPPPSTAEGPTRPTPILIDASPPQEEGAGSAVMAAGTNAPTAEASPHQRQQQQVLVLPQPSFSSVATTTAGSPSGAAGGSIFPRLRSLTPQPYATTQGSPRRRHRFVNVNLPSAPPPPQTELFRTFQRTVRDVYDVHERLSEGTYGEVFKGVDKRTGALVALKRLKTLSSHQGFPQTSLREVIALRHIQNQRERLEARQRQGGPAKAAVSDPLAEVAQLCDVLVFDRQQPDIVLVFAYASASLAGLLRRQFIFSPAELAYVMKKLLTAVRKLHEMSIIHRDIKSDNVLLTSDAEVQLTDFGLCSIVGAGGVAAWRTPSVITLAYRPPEMLLGSTAYDEKVDVWSVGCLLAQLYLYEPPFYRHRALQRPNQPGQPQQQRTAATELEQLSRITEVLGPLPPVRVFRPDACQHMRVLEQLEQQGKLAEAGKAAQPANWGKLQSLFEPSFLYQQFHGFRGWFEAEVQRARHQPPPRRPSQAALDVLCAALQLDPQQRPSAAELLRMPYFTTLDDAPLLGAYQRPLAVTPEREEEVRRGLVLKVQRCGDSHTQRRPH
ncbi:putative Protein kinase [Leptomonas pyrrhocoris]|uniref:Protein kinase domain-containing protein n=1 Tax=Leptomonas pyrrhocoris TaxID=157538 RepID=A0A0M9FWP7_LEPPY|nr:putative Protein kinase [Leptomonas pyrrhocoris]KPA77509.1 putative Protein kinase [Leptomonas pyrrhocoris]|eukprot:XP_015655948.1 putative Protein kinase [Leptomonas pyrrhocoris]